MTSLAGSAYAAESHSRGLDGNVIRCLTALILSMLAVPAYAQQLKHKDTCSVFWSAVVTGGNPAGYGGPDVTKPPVIFGKDYHVPALHLRFVDAKTGKPIVPKVVNVQYFWEWLEYPYPEHGWGVWSEVEDWIKCTTGGDNDVIVPARTVKPVGWYNGKYTKFPFTLFGSTLPHFDHLEIVVVLKKGGWQDALIVKKKQLDQYKGTVATVTFVNTNPHAEFQKRPKGP